MVDDAEKICFVISPIGGEGTETRERADQVMRHVIEPAAKFFNYKVIRADVISTPGMITHQVLEHVLESQLVIADLTDSNPNVFYELAVRHFVYKPYIQLIDRAQSLPFDVAGYRTVFFDLSSLDSAADAVEQVKGQIEALEKDPSDLDTPISITADLMSLGRMMNQGQGDVSHLVPLLTDISSTMHDNGREIRGLRVQIAQMNRRQQGIDSPQERPTVAGIPAVAYIPEVVHGLILALRSIRRTHPEVHHRAGAVVTSIRHGDMDDAKVLLTEIRSMIETNADVPEEVRERVLFEVANAIQELAAQQGGKGDVDDLPF